MPRYVGGSPNNVQNVTTKEPHETMVCHILSPVHTEVGRKLLEFLKSLNHPVERVEGKKSSGLWAASTSP